MPVRNRNPIDQRHANHTGAGCPVFWRRFGYPLTCFFAIYPWAIFILLFAAEAFVQSAGGVFEMTNNQLTTVNRLYTIAGIGYLFLFLPALAWYLFYVAAVLRGYAEGGKTASLRVWFACVVIWLSGCLSPYFAVNTWL
jgi:hypothetical protein